MIFKKKKKKEKEDQTVSKSSIKIRVFMRFGAEIRQKRAEYMAIEKRDGYNNLVAINETYMHNEDVDFSQEEVYSSMNITLGIDGLDKDKTLKEIDKRIDKHKKRVNAIEKHPELNVLANIWDERRKLREFKIFRNYVQNRSKDGAYFTIDNGVRVYDFESIDGFLIPIWHGADNLSDYPDFTRKKKITMQETANLENYLSNKGTQKIMQNTLLFVLIASIVVFTICCILAYKLYGLYGDKMDKYEAPAEFCAEQMVETYTIFNRLLKETAVHEYLVKTNSTVKQDVDNKIKQLMPKR